MAYVIGTDEAGYGPNLGPLVIGATLWHLADDVPPAQFDARLRQTIDCDARLQGNGQSTGRFVIGDSKKLYQGGGTLGPLEDGVLSAIASCGDLPRTSIELWSALAADSLSQIAELPCRPLFDIELPRDADTESIQQHAAGLRNVYPRAEIQLLRIAATALFPAEFNRRTDQWGSKGTVLSQATIALIADLLATIDAGPVTIVCDKHGGRNRYGDLLQRQFPDEWIQVVEEGRPASVYRFGSSTRRIEICFRTSGEEHAAPALASMTAKYLRELSMAAFNQFWQQHIPDLRPTAGYPVDAVRFKAEIATVQQSLGIDDSLLWRTK